MPKKIPLLSAILICLNTIAGAGLFINLSTLTYESGPLGFSIYLLAALLLIPLLICIAALGRKIPESGGLYAYASHYFNKRMGFISGWGYFLSKATSAGLLTHILAVYLKNNISAFASINLLALTYGIIIFITLLIIGGLKFGGYVQYLFIALKTLPILFALTCGVLLFDSSNYTTHPVAVGTILPAIPTALFALIGFEIAVSITSLLANPEKNIRIALYTSFSIIVAICVSMQFLAFGALGLSLGNCYTPLITLGKKISPSFEMIGRLANGIFFSAVTGTITSILGSNSWNLHTLAKNGHLPGKQLLMFTNKQHTPIISLLIHASISCIIITISSRVIPLQNMAVLGLFISYLITSLVAYKACRQQENPLPIQPITALTSIAVCSGITLLCITNIISSGVSFSFLFIFLIGCALSILKSLLS